MDYTGAGQCLSDIVKSSKVREVLWRKRQLDLVQLALIAVGKDIVILGQLLPDFCCPVQNILLFVLHIFTFPQKTGALPKGKAPIKRFLSIHRIYSACGSRSTHGLAPQSADTEPVHCFIATDSWSMPLSSSLIIPQKNVSASS